MFRFYTPWKRRKTFSFLTFSGGIEMEYCQNWGNSCILQKLISTEFRKILNY